MAFFEDGWLSAALPGFPSVPNMQVDNLTLLMGEFWLDDNCINCGVDVLRVRPLKCSTYSRSCARRMGGPPISWYNRHGSGRDVRWLFGSESTRAFWGQYLNESFVSAGTPSNSFTFHFATTAIGMSGLSTCSSGISELRQALGGLLQLGSYRLLSSCWETFCKKI